MQALTITASDKEAHIVRVATNLHEVNLISFAYFTTCLFECFVYIFFSLFNWEDYMIKKRCLIATFMHMCCSHEGDDSWFFG